MPFLFLHRNHIFFEKISKSYRIIKKCARVWSRRVVAVAVGAPGSAPDAAAAAVLLVGEGVDAFALAAGLRVPARLVAASAVLEAVLGVDAGALAARRARAPVLQADGRRLLAAVVERRRRREVGGVGEEAASPQGRRRRRRRHRRCLQGSGRGEGEGGERHEKDGGFSHGGRRARHGAWARLLQCARRRLGSLQI